MRFASIHSRVRSDRCPRSLDGRRVDRQRKPRVDAALASGRWPGNIRELENVMERAVLLAQDSLLAPGDFPGLSAGQVLETPDSEELGLKEFGIAEQSFGVGTIGC